MLSSVVIEPKKPADSCVIWLHGLGANGHDFEPIVPELGLPDSLATRFIFPHAPEMPVTINGGMVMPAWYDILEMNIDLINQKIEFGAPSTQWWSQLATAVAGGLAFATVLTLVLTPCLLMLGRNKHQK